MDTYELFNKFFKIYDYVIKITDDITIKELKDISNSFSKYFKVSCDVNENIIGLNVKKQIDLDLLVSLLKSHNIKTSNFIIISENINKKGE